MLGKIEKFVSEFLYIASKCTLSRQPAVKKPQLLNASDSFTGNKKAADGDLIPSAGGLLLWMWLC